MSIFRASDSKTPLSRSVRSILLPEDAEKAEEAEEAEEQSEEAASAAAD